MAYREVTRVEIQDIIRRWQAGNSQRKIAMGTGLSRDTIAKYIAAAQGAGIAQGGLAATEEQLSGLAAIGQVGPRQVETPRQDLPGAVGRPDFPVAHWGPAADDPHSGVAGSQGLPGIVSVVAPLHPEAQLATTQQDHGAHGGHSTGRGGGGGLRPAGDDYGPRDGASPCGVGADHRAGLLSAQLGLADPRANAGGHHRKWPA